MVNKYIPIDLPKITYSLFLYSKINILAYSKYIPHSILYRYIHFLRMKYIILIIKQILQKRSEIVSPLYFAYLNNFLKIILLYENS